MVAELGQRPTKELCKKVRAGEGRKKEEEGGREKRREESKKMTER
jgi:hypothetical protein